MAAGKNHVIKNPNFDNLYYAPHDIADKINSWLDGKLFLYNNNYKNRWKQLFSDIQELVEKQDCKLIVLDNLMALNISDFDGVKNERLQGCVRVALRSRNALDDGFQNVFHAHAGLAAGADNLFAFASEQLYDFVFHHVGHALPLQLSHGYLRLRKPRNSSVKRPFWR